jgi:hypothetical protein
MTFKELSIELMDQGWRCYKMDDLNTRGSALHSLANRHNILVQVYEGKSLVFVKDCKSNFEISNEESDI